MISVYLLLDWGGGVVTYMRNEQSAKRSALKGQPVYSPGQRPGYQCINAYAL